ncbi:hypothetical protein ANO14919_122080 [Xylariales sp. No.14919]|nr:hypothetical protein ANO14919_122080 [Xylariales sp. No.14919]
MFTGYVGEEPSFFAQTLFGANRSEMGNYSGHLMMSTDLARCGCGLMRFLHLGDKDSSRTRSSVDNAGNNRVGMGLPR